MNQVTWFYPICFYVRYSKPRMLLLRPRGVTGWMGPPITGGLSELCAVLRVVGEPGVWSPSEPGEPLSRDTEDSGPDLGGDKAQASGVALLTARQRSTVSPRAARHGTRSALQWVCSAESASPSSPKWNAPLPLGIYGVAPDSTVSTDEGNWALHLSEDRVPCGAPVRRPGSLCERHG